MFAKEMFVQSSGPIERLHFKFPFNEDGSPKPLVIVGLNGSGKSNILSTLADALIEAAADSYDNVVPTVGTSRQWFRLVGGRNTRYGRDASISIVSFDVDGAQVFYFEKAGDKDRAYWEATIPLEMRAAITWPDNGPAKDFVADASLATAVLEKGTYAFFPASRYEVPHWLNTESIIRPRHDLESRIQKRLSRPIVVEHGNDRLTQWLLSLFTDSRAEFNLVITNKGVSPAIAQGSSANFLSRQTLNHFNYILTKVFDKSTARVDWLNRFDTDKIGISIDDTIVAKGLNSLSSAQASLLSIFGTLLMYGDQAIPHQFAKAVAEYEGIVVIDEIDAHMHVGLLTESIPLLIKYFPRVQFVLSAHSPLLLLGMRKIFGDSGFEIMQLPSGTIIDAERYSEFSRALDALKETDAFTKSVSDHVSSKAGACIKILMEGETDPLYMKAAAEVMGFQDLLVAVTFDWIGFNDPTSGSINAGKDSLNRARLFIMSNQAIVNGFVVLLYDSDANKIDEDLGKLWVRSIPFNEENSIILKGIENLLPECKILEEDYDKSEHKDGYGGAVNKKSLNKMRLARRLCDGSSASETFVKFHPALLMLRELVADLQT